MTKKGIGRRLRLGTPKRRINTQMKTRQIVIVNVALLIASENSTAQQANDSSSRSGPVIIDASNADNSIDPASVTYTSRDKNIYGQPMEIIIPSRFETDSGLVAVARRLAVDNAKFPLVRMPVQIYDEHATREVAEYWRFGSTRDLRITGPDQLVRKIVRFSKEKSSAASFPKRTEQEESPNGTSVDPSAVAYKIVEGPGTRLGHIVIPPRFATEAGLIAVAKRVDKDTANFPVVAFEIYDNAKAEQLVTSGNLTDSNQAFCERHELASYERNLNANINRLQLYETVTGGAKKDISFTTGEPTGGIFSHQTPSP
jgi:hypothetical protein